MVTIVIYLKPNSLEVPIHKVNEINYRLSEIVDLVLKVGVNNVDVIWNKPIDSKVHGHVLIQIFIPEKINDTEVTQNILSDLKAKVTYYLSGLNYEEGLNIFFHPVSITFVKTYF